MSSIILYSEYSRYGDVVEVPAHIFGKRLTLLVETDRYGRYIEIPMYKKGDTYIPKKTIYGNRDRYGFGFVITSTMV